jgi:hypothetical protein
MRYVTMTAIAPEEVLARARHFFARNTQLELVEEQEDELVFQGEIGRAVLRVDREHGRTNVRVETDRVVGLDVTDIAKRFLYTLRIEGQKV